MKASQQLRDRIAAAIREAASEQTYWVPGPHLSRIYADAVIAELEKPAYCNRCGIPHHGDCRRDSKTIAEQLDAAPDGEAFGRVVQSLFSALEKAMDDE